MRPHPRIRKSIKWGGRVALVLVLWVLLGAVINAGVIFGIALLAPPKILTGKYKAEGDGRAWYGQLHNAWGRVRLIEQTDTQRLGQYSKPLVTMVAGSVHFDPDWKFYWGQAAPAQHVHLPFWWEMDRTTPLASCPSWSNAARERGAALYHRNIKVETHAIGWPAFAIVGGAWWGVFPAIAGGLSGPYPFEGPCTREHVWDLGPWWEAQVGHRVLLPIQPLWMGFAANAAFYGSLAWAFLRGPCVVRRWRRLHFGRCSADMTALALR